VILPAPAPPVPVTTDFTLLAVSNVYEYGMLAIREAVVVDPDPGGVLDVDGVIVPVPERDVADDDVRRLGDVEAAAGDDRPALPRMLLFEPTRIMPEHEIVPEMRMTAALVPETALVSEEALFTVTAEALPPPVVPPPWVAQPTSRLVAPPSTAFGSSRTLPLSLDLSL